MNRYSRTMSLALLACMTLAGCASPANATVHNLDKPTFSSALQPVNDGDTFMTTRHNAYTVDNVQGQPFNVRSENPAIASVSVDSFDQVNVKVSSPGKTKIHVTAGETMRTYTVIVQ